MSETTAAITSRRAFLRKGAVAAAALSTASALLSACAGESKTEPTVTKAPEHSARAAPAAAAPKMKSAAERAAEMDAMHEAGMKAFPAKTSMWGNQPLAPKIVGGVKVFELTASRMKWETAPGQFVDAMCYNRQVPGPQIRCKEGERVRIVLENELDQSTAMHFHGLEVPNSQDGVPFITQPVVKPGETFTYEFNAPNAGSHMYHSHHNAAQQTPMGQKLRLRFMNEGMMIHPMHLHGMHFTVFAKDGWLQPQPWKCDTLNVAPGERWDVIVDCNNPGVWAFHCHILPHAESEHGMFGMVTALIVEK
jgi:FtsP/CotA-like multicopper oxidase with cupredoxin domain